MVIEDKLEHKANADFPMDVTLSNMYTEATEVQFLRASSEMLVADSRNFTEVRIEQSKTSTMPLPPGSGDGMVAAVNALQPRNTSIPR
jgi:hypothetical protein